MTTRKHNLSGIYLYTFILEESHRRVDSATILKLTTILRNSKSEIVVSITFSWFSRRLVLQVASRCPTEISPRGVVQVMSQVIMLYPYVNSNISSPDHLQNFTTVLQNSVESQSFLVR